MDQDYLGKGERLVELLFCTWCAGVATTVTAVRSMHGGRVSLFRVVEDQVEGFGHSFEFF